jgi:hypothetical protein
MYSPIAPIQKLKFLDPFVIETPVCEVYYNEVFIGYANEYTVRNIQLAVKNGEVENKYHFTFNKGCHKHIIDDNFKIKPAFDKGFYSLSSELAYQLID